MPVAKPQGRNFSITNHWTPKKKSLLTVRPLQNFTKIKKTSGLLFCGQDKTKITCLASVMKPPFSIKRVKQCSPSVVVGIIDNLDEKRPHQDSQQSHDHSVCRKTYSWATLDV